MRLLVFVVCVALAAAVNQLLEEESLGIDPKTARALNDIKIHLPLLAKDPIARGRLEELDEMLRQSRQILRDDTDDKKIEQPVLTGQPHLPSPPKTIKSTYLGIINDCIAILASKGFLRNSGIVGRILYLIYRIAQDIERLERKGRNVNCPASYDTVGDLCLSIDKLETQLSFEEARWYCQALKGGDLVMFRDANEFYYTLDYLRKKDTQKEYDYYVGAADDAKEGFFTYVDGSKVPLDTPFWGFYAGNLLPNLDGDNDDDCVILENDDGWLMHDIDEDIIGGVDDPNPLPLCQYIPERDFANFQIGSTIIHDWDGFNEWYAGDTESHLYHPTQTFVEHHGGPTSSDPNYYNPYGGGNPWDRYYLPGLSYNGYQSNHISDKSDLWRSGLNKPHPKFATLLAEKRQTV